MKSSFDFGFFLSTQIHSQTANSNNKTSASDGVQDVPHLPPHLASTFLSKQPKQDCYSPLPKYSSLKRVLPLFQEEPPSAHILTDESRQTGLAKFPSSLPLGHTLLSLGHVSLWLVPIPQT